MKCSTETNEKNIILIKSKKFLKNQKMLLRIFTWGWVYERDRSNCNDRVFFVEWHAFCYYIVSSTYI